MPTDVCPKRFFCGFGTVSDDSTNANVAGFKPTQCPEGQFCLYGTGKSDATVPGLVKPQVCIAGTICNAGSGEPTGTKMCDPGYYCVPACKHSFDPAKGEKCTAYKIPVQKPADKGYFVKNKASVAQTPCPIGYYNDAVKQTQCLVCKAGHYCPDLKMKDTDLK